MSRRWILLILAALAIVVYLPALWQPFIEDDYPNIEMSLDLGSPHGITQLLTGTYRQRATQIWLMCAMYHLAGMHAAPFYAASILLHVLNTWLVYALGTWRPIGFTLSAWAAAFFAIAEGHQEAIMWLSGSTEVLQFVFGMAAFLCWVRFLENRPHRWIWYAAAMPAFVLCILSKESSAVFAVLFLFPLIFDRKDALYALPLLLLCAGAAFLVYQSRSWSFRFQDRSFSIHAPFWLILPKNVLRVLWPWGLAGLAAVFTTGRYKRVAAIAFAWIAVALIPYSFLTYSTEIPSRQTYLASFGLSLIVAAGLLAVQERFLARRRAIAVAACTLLLFANVGYIWTKKRRQFAKRAEPTQELLALARSTSGPIYIRCYPRPPLIAEAAVHLAAGQPGREVIVDPTEARRRGAVVTFCYDRK